MAKFLTRKFKISFPPLNHPPILWRFINAMLVPYETYCIVMAITRLLGLDEFRLTTDSAWEKKGGSAESKLMALTIVACKVGFDLENTPAWKDWSRATDEELEKEKLSRNDELTPTDILTMSDERLDQYMDWLQSSWINGDHDRLNSTDL
jgi:RNA polymerase I-specific transcription initiation factor RRN7